MNPLQWFMAIPRLIFRFIRCGLFALLFSGFITTQLRADESFRPGASIFPFPIADSATQVLYQWISPNKILILTCPSKLIDPSLATDTMHWNAEILELPSGHRSPLPRLAHLLTKTHASIEKFSTGQGGLSPDGKHLLWSAIGNPAAYNRPDAKGQVLTGVHDDPLFSVCCASLEGSDFAEFRIGSWQSVDAPVPNDVAWCADSQHWLEVETRHLHLFGPSRNPSDDMLIGTEIILTPGSLYQSKIAKGPSTKIHYSGEGWKMEFSRDDKTLYSTDDYSDRPVAYCFDTDKNHPSLQQPIASAISNFLPSLVDLWLSAISPDGSMTVWAELPDEKTMRIVIASLSAKQHFAPKSIWTDNAYSNKIEFPHDFQWSPDQRKVSFVRENRLYVLLVPQHNRRKKQKDPVLLMYRSTGSFVD